MIFFAILLALLIEQAHPLSEDNPVFAALQGWARLMRRNLDTGQKGHAWLGWVFATGGPAALAALVYWGLWNFSALLAFAWLVAILYVTLGFRQFSHHFTDIREALDQGNEPLAREKLSAWLGIDTASLTRAELLRQVIEQSALAAHRHVFGVLAAFVIFWLLGLGPAGAVFYRLAEYVSRDWRAQNEGTPSLAAHQVGAAGWGLVDFLPARFTALGFAVVGNFEEAVASWRGEAERFAPGSDGVVLAATSGALNVRLSARASESDEEGVTRAEPQLAHLASAVGLVWRSVVLWMLLLALLTLARLLA